MTCLRIRVLYFEIQKIYIMLTFLINELNNILELKK